MIRRLVGKIKTSYQLFQATACLIGFSAILWGSSAWAIQGVCANCHTMHNSQNNLPMNFDDSTTPNGNLVRGTCYGCHAQAGPDSVAVFGTSEIPQVFHSGATYLAGGNFGYITGLAGTGAADSKGHNISDLTGTDSILYSPPGGISQFDHDNGDIVNTNNLTCAGTRGCHGYRLTGDPLLEGITGAHHSNAGGQLDQATEPGNSYRFLMGVQGFESPDWQETPASEHNEYFGLDTPVQLGCGNGGNALSCHGTAPRSGTGVQPPDGTMSQYCATCHGNFHTLATSSSDGVGVTAISPFIRHPTDLSLPATGEYADYTVYNLNAPVARLTVPSLVSNVVTPGSDAVMCLSCHVAHASDYPDMLRWDYLNMTPGTGCFICHTTKD